MSVDGRQGRRGGTRRQVEDEGMHHPRAWGTDDIPPLQGGVAGQPIQAAVRDGALQRDADTGRRGHREVEVQAHDER